MRRRSGYVQIDVQDMLDQLEDDDLLEELRARKLMVAQPGTCDLDIVCEAYRELQGHRPDEARCILERLIFPKWKSAAKCDDEYQLWRGTRR